MQVVRGVPIETEVVAEPRDKAIGDGTGQCISAGTHAVLHAAVQHLSCQL